MMRERTEEETTTRREKNKKKRRRRHAREADDGERVTRARSAAREASDSPSLCEIAANVVPVVVAIFVVLAAFVGGRRTKRGSGAERLIPAEASAGAPSRPSWRIVFLSFFLLKKKSHYLPAAPVTRDGDGVDDDVGDQETVVPAASEGVGPSA